MAWPESSVACVSSTYFTPYYPLFQNPSMDKYVHFLNVISWGFLAFQFQTLSAVGKSKLWYDILPLEMLHLLFSRFRFVYFCCLGLWLVLHVLFPRPCFCKDFSQGECWSVMKRLAVVIAGVILTTVYQNSNKHFVLVGVFLCFSSISPGMISFVLNSFKN